VNLPDALAQVIGEVVESGKHGYTSIPDFVKEAVRRARSREIVPDRCRKGKKLSCLREINRNQLMGMIFNCLRSTTSPI